MLRPKKKISKRELKEDALITTYVKVTSLYEENKRTISIAVAVLALAVLAIVVFVKNRADNNEKAIAQLGAVFHYYDQGEFQTAIDGIPERNIAGLRSIVENFGNSATGDLARFYMANALFNMAKYDEAKKLFDEFSPINEMLIVSRLSGIGACAEALGNHKEAAENFEKAATKYAKDPNAAENLSNAARNYGEAGEKEKAIEIYKRIRKSYPTSPFARDVDRFIAQLSV